MCPSIPSANWVLKRRRGREPMQIDDLQTEERVKTGNLRWIVFRFTWHIDLCRRISLCYPCSDVRFLDYVGLVDRLNDAVGPPHS